MNFMKKAITEIGENVLKVGGGCLAAWVSATVVKWAICYFDVKLF